MSFHPGDTFLYVNVHDQLVKFIRNDHGTWIRHHDDEPDLVAAPVDDSYMANHINGLMTRPNSMLSWGFYTKGGAS